MHAFVLLVAFLMDGELFRYDFEFNDLGQCETSRLNLGNQISSRQGTQLLHARCYRVAPNQLIKKIPS